jgi:hypothetical protein
MTIVCEGYHSRAVVFAGMPGKPMPESCGELGAAGMLFACTAQRIPGQSALT